MTDTQWLRIRSFMDSCSCTYVGDETRLSSFCDRAVRDDAVRRPLAAVVGRVREGERGRR